MPCAVEIREVASQQIAVVRGPTTVANLPMRIRALFDQFYAGFSGKGGFNIVFYPNWDDVGEFEIECGVQVESGGNSSTPGGMVATAVHVGAYDHMKATHEEIHQYIGESGYRVAGPSWEVYGHWSDDPAQLRTDIFYLLAHRQARLEV